jgi:hypothetical protein
MYTSVQAQNTNPTPYQKKQLELSKKWFQILSGSEMTMADELFYEKLASGQETNDFLLGLVIINYAMTHSKSQCEKVFTQMNKEFKDAEKLKNATDFRLEKEAKLKKELIEKQKLLRNAQEAYERTDKGQIYKSINVEFYNWNQKGEFEKEIDYINRIKNNSVSAFDSICLLQISNRIEMLNDINWTKELSNYNSEDEKYTIKFTINNTVINCIYDISISEAKKFKEKWYSLNFEIDNYNWSFINNNLCPTVITLKNKVNNRYYNRVYENNSDDENRLIKYDFEVTEPLLKEIIIYFDSLGLENNMLSGYLFKYSNAKEIKEKQEVEQRNIDSIIIAQYNQKLDSIYDMYNVKLLNFKYNISKDTLTRTIKLITIIDIDNEYEKSVENVNYKYESLYSELNNNFRVAYESCYSYFVDSDEFENYYIKGKFIYVAEVEKRKVIKYLNDNLNFITTMDFQREEKKNIGSTLSEHYNGETRDYDEINDKRKRILSSIKNCRYESYYNQVLEFVIFNNKDMNKEWKKNGNLFTDKQEFYEAYIQNDYKSILKEKKK